MNLFLRNSQTDLPSDDLSISPDEVSAQIELILRSEGFKKSARLQDFLKYIVDETLQGRAADLKGVAIARAVFSVDDSFDPETNSIVRVEAGRLRQRLYEYYMEAGRSDPVLISIPKGSYEPRFKVNAKLAGERAAQSSSDRLTLSLSKKWLAVGILTAAIVLAMFSRLLDTNTPTIDDSRIQSIEMEPGPKSEALVLFEQAFVVMIPPDDGTRLRVAADMFERVIEIDPEMPAGYAGKSIALSINVLFVKPVNGEEYLSEAVRLAEHAISIDQEYSLAYAALALAQSFDSDNDRALASARRSMAIQRDDAIANSMTSIALLNVGATHEAIELLSEALRLNPDEPRTPYLNLLGIAHFAIGDFSAASEYFDRNLARNGPAGPHMDVFRAATFAHLGRDFQARSMIEKLSAEYPEYPVEAWLRNYIKSEADLQATMSMLRALSLSTRKIDSGR
jgi:tetratricopeptide (TPR) repeat protein